jgi:putative ABC transport system permease protein
MIRNYWLVAIRKLLRHKIHSIINVLGLAIGIASCLMIYLLTRFELSYDTFHPNKDRIYRVVATLGHDNDTQECGFVLQPLPLALRKELTGCAHVSAFYDYSAKITVPQTGPGSTSAEASGAGAVAKTVRQPKKFDAPDRGTPSPVIVTDSQYFGIFHYQWLAGNAATSLSRPFSVVLSENEMINYFGHITPDQAIGRSVIYNDSLYTSVSGIVRDWTGNTDLNFKDFISLATVDHSFIKGDIDMTAWGMWDFDSQGFIELAPGVTPEQVERQFPAILKKYTHQPPGYKSKISLQPLRDIHFNAAYPDDFSRKAHLPTLYGLMGIAGFILLLAAINFINLATAQSLGRTREIGIRKVLGGRRKDIAIQFLSETLLTTTLAVVLSVSITPMILSLLHDYFPPGVRLDTTWPTLTFLALITAGTALLAGWYPARVISKLLPVLSLKGQATKTVTPNRYLHRGLIVLQFTISLTFIMCTVVVARQIHYVLDKDLGFKSDAIITLYTSFNYPKEDREALADKLREIPGVAMVTRHMETPQARGHPGTIIDYKGPRDVQIDADFDMADTNYLSLFGIKLAAGRNLFPSDTIRELLINETAAKALGFDRPRDAIGHSVTTGFGGKGGPIVGIIRDFHSHSLHEPIAPFFLSTNRESEHTISLRLAPEARTPEAIHTALGKLQKLWHATYPNEKFKYSFLDETIANLYSREQHISSLLRLAMAIAISISCMGLLGLATFAAEQRSKEISIRKVLGASVTRIIALLTGNFLWPVALAIVIATPVAWYFMQSWLQGFVYRTTVPWWLFGCCGIAAIAIALLTVGFQAVRTAMINPANHLRNE